MDLDSLRPHRRRSSGAQQPAHTDFRPWGRRSGTFAQSWYATGHRRWTASRRPSGQDAPQRTFTTAVRPTRWRQPTQAPASPKLQSKDGRLPDQASRPTLQRPAIAGFALQPISGQDSEAVGVRGLRAVAEPSNGRATVRNRITVRPEDFASRKLTALFVANFPQPQSCWRLSTQGLHPTLLDGESRRWCCGISLRYARRRHLAGKASAARLAQPVREARRKRGNLGAGRGQHLETRPQRSGYQPDQGHYAGSRLMVTTSSGLGAARMVAAPAPSPCAQRMSVRKARGSGR